VVEGVSSTGDPDLDALLGIEAEEAVEAEAPSGSTVEVAPEETTVETAERPEDAPSEDAADAELALEEASEPGAPSVEASDDVAAAPIPVVEREDGSLLIADTYVVRGEGTREKPYEMGLDLLISVQDVYNPRQGRDELPAGLNRFKGKRVRIVGNMLFPLWAEETDELLLMKNQWDGCCVGVPPTPYDAVEVKLSDAVDLSRMGSSYGPVEGTFDVEPYIRSNWLLGLYVMEDARLVDGG